ncbi:MAG: sensor histidine kinase [Gammaproteobacteria bacterium]|nr:sensor histidine kinase [Gammaproteobacteria bacterium]
MDSEAQKLLDAESRRTTLSRLAEYLEAQRDAVTEQWLLAVRRDPNIATADRLTHQQLVDHLPGIYEECCQFLRRRDTSLLVDDAQTDAKEHGEFRWQNGYRIDELIRELEAFRRIMAATVLRFVEVEVRFAGTLERQASALVHQFFGEVTVSSVKQFVQEQQVVVSLYTDRLQAANRRARTDELLSERALGERHNLTSVVAHELRNLLQGLTMAARIWEEPPGAEQRPAEAASVWVREQIRDLEQLLLQLLEQSNVIDGAAGRAGRVDLAMLHTELMLSYRAAAAEKGLRLQGEVCVLPVQVEADLTKLRLLAESLLSHAITHTSSGTVDLSFTDHDTQRWTMCISDTGPGLSGAVAEQLFGAIHDAPEAPQRASKGLAMTRSLIAAVGGSLQVTTQAGAGTRIEVSGAEPRAKVLFGYAFNVSKCARTWTACVPAFAKQSGP